MNTDRAAREVDNVLPAALNDTLVVKWALVAEIIGRDGEHTVVSLGSPGITQWDRLGLLAVGDVMSRQDMADAPDVADHDDE